MSGNDGRMPVALDVLAEPQRRRILDELRDGDRMVGQLSRSLDLAQPSVSKHLKVLRDAGLVRVRADAQRRWYGLRAEPLAEMDEWLTPYRWMWESRLDVLGAHLDARAEKKGARR